MITALAHEAAHLGIKVLAAPSARKRAQVVRTNAKLAQPNEYLGVRPLHPQLDDHRGGNGTVAAEEVVLEKLSIARTSCVLRFRV